MTPPKKPGSNDPLPNLDIRRVRVNRDGYDASGAYWGAGLDLFIATSEDGSDEVTVRARTTKEARDKVAAELARQPGAAAIHDDPIGGMAPRKTKYEITWRNPITASTVVIRVTHARDYLIAGNDHLEIESIKPKKAPLPISETGFRSHFMPTLDLINAGGPVTFVTAWIKREAAGKSWQKQSTIKSQGDLFQWAEARTDVGARKKAKPQPSKPAPPPRKKPTRAHAPE